MLRAKGMEFEDLGEAKALLARISYFRLKYFWTDLIDDSTDGDFLPDTSFDMVMKRYNFAVSYTHLTLPTICSV